MLSSMKSLSQHHKSVLMAGIALSVIALSPQVIAQDTQDELVIEADAAATTSTEPQNETQAEAALETEAEPVDTEPKARNMRLEEIVVTAQKRSQNVQEVPISVTALSGEALREMNIQGVTELTIAMPNATLAVSPSFSTIYVRGIGTGLNDGFEPSVGLYVDNIYMGRQSYLNDALMDIEVVELLRGPQGTLFGKNTVAGALSFTNTIPNYEWFMTLDVMRGTDNNRRISFAGNAPVWDDKIALRLSAQHHKSDGAIFNAKRGIGVLRNDKNGARLKARVDLTPDLYVTAAAEYSLVKDNGPGFELLKGNGQTEILFSPFDPTYEEEPNRVSHLDSDSYSERETVGGNFNVFWDLGGHEVALIAGFNEFTEILKYDSDASPIPILTWDNDDDYTQWQAELRLVSPPGKFEYVGGLFYFGNQYDAFTEFRQFDDPNVPGALLNGALGQEFSDALSAVFDPLTGGVAPLTDIITADGLFANFSQSTETLALYAQATYRPWSWLELIAGVRGHYEQKEATISQEFEKTGVVLNAAFGTVEYDFTGDKTEKNVTPKVAVRYLVNDDINIYATIGKGYKAGGFNPTAPDPSKAVFDEETSWTYEAGLKSEWFDGRMTANFALFRTEFTDMQISVLSGAGEAFFVDNAASSTVQGFEWEFKGIPWAGNTVTFAGGYLHAYYDNFEKGPCQAGEEGNAEGFCDMSGERMVRAPKWDIMASLTQLIPLGNLPFGAFVGFDTAMQTEHFTDQDNDINTQQKTYYILNTRVGIGAEDQSWVLSINGHNVTDTMVLGGVTDVPLQEGAYFGIIAPGRFWTAELRLTL
ncbi:MAG: TonB-dependent receptor [Alphaproteobacteria bacterium]